MRKRLIISLLVVAVIAVIVSLVRPAPQIISTLPRKDVTQITKAVRPEMRREVLPDISGYSISQLPASLRRYWSEQIMSIYDQGDGTVSVMTGHKRNGEWNFHGSAFLLKQGPRGWVISSRSSWISSSEEAPNLEILQRMAGGASFLRLLLSGPPPLNFCFRPFDRRHAPHKRNRRAVG